MLAKRLIKSNDAGGGACTNTVDLYNPFPDGGGVALYQLNGDATDVSGNYDGTATNVTYGAGQFGQAGIFNGSSSSIYINATSTTPLDFSNRNYSISAWVKTTHTVAGIILSKYGDSPSLRSFSFLLNNSGNVFHYEVGSGDNSTISNASVNDGAWHHVVVTKSPTETIIYVDGSFDIKNSNTFTSNTAGTEPLKIGRDDVTPDWFNGSIDQVRIFNRALRPYEVEALYTEEYCTPTIVPSEHFNTVLYTGNGTTLPITGVGFQPDFVWLKRRDAGYPYTHKLIDSVRGATIRMSSDETGPDITEINGLKSFDSDGFTLGGDGGYNVNGAANVAWNFKAGGAAVTNTDGTITSQVSANTEAGFSIVSWTGNSSSGSTVGHGLSDTPKMIIVKSRNEIGGSSKNWTVYSEEIGNTQYLYLNTTAAASVYNFWNNTSPTNSVFSLSSDTNVNSSVGNYIAYCFAEVEGFSNFGSYVGTGASGNTIVTGFEPAFAIFKRVSSTSSWYMIDNKRNPSNPRDLFLNADTSDAEYVPSYGVEFLENGFSFISTDLNGTGQTWMYMAFAADPTTIEPTLEDSFNTVTYTGQGGSESITSVGFQPDLTWIKARETSGKWNVLYDSVRGTNKMLSSNATDSEATYGSVTPTANGFDLGSLAGDLNSSGEDYVAWNWKGAELPAINSNGSIPSVVSANPASGFSIVSYKGSGANATIGHGLSDAPDMIIVKRRNASGSWNVYHSALGNNSTLILQLTIAELIGEGTWGTTTPTESVFTVGTGINDTNNYIAYCFAEVAGFSKFGSYIGNASVSGPTVTTGFEPAFVMVKQSDFTNGWLIYDNKRNPTNSRDKRIFANLSAGEYTDANQAIDFNPTGFQIIGTDSGHNRLDGTFIYMAFANQF